MALGSNRILDDLVAKLDYMAGGVDNVAGEA
jgi:hypothetical protein